MFNLRLNIRIYEQSIIHAISRTVKMHGLMKACLIHLAKPNSSRLGSAYRHSAAIFSAGLDFAGQSIAKFQVNRPGNELTRKSSTS